MISISDMIGETKLHSSFPFLLFILNSCRTDPNRNGGGILVSINENIPSKELKKYPIQSDMDGTLVEMNFQKCRWFLFGSYHCPSLLTKTKKSFASSSVKKK